jgi:hypothetical protein
MTLRSPIATAAVCAAALIAPASAAPASPACPARHEHSGCRLQQARYAGSSFTFAVRAGMGVASGFGNLTCTGSSGARGRREVLYAPTLTRPKAIPHPVVGRTYRRHFVIGSHVAGKLQRDGTIDLTVTVVSASRLRMTFAEHLRQEASGRTDTCDGRSSETLKRVA